jgi:serine protease Do
LNPKQNKRKLPAYLHPANYFVPIIEKVKHSVVSIKTGLPNSSYRHLGRGPSKPFTNIGSGFVIHSTGYILTSRHVIHDAEEIKVKFYNGRECTAKVVYADENWDLGIIKISPNQLLRLRPISIGSSEKSKVGEMVISIGNPMGLEHTITTGIISAKNRNILNGDKLYEDIIQTDCAINPGNSGGPLINLNGEVIGINAFIAKNSPGLGFSIGIDSVKEVIEKYL